MWRFDLSGLTASGGSATVQLLTTLTDASGNIQPITGKPELGDVGGNTIVFVGTGRYLGITDLATTGIQTLYAVKDTLNTISGALYPNIRSAGGNFIQQVLTDTTCPAGSPVSICSTGQAVRTSTNNAVNFATNNGWYVDLPNRGERANTDPQLALGTLAYTTNILDANACTVGGSSYLNYFDYRTGSFVATSTTAVAGIQLGNALATRPVLLKLPNNKVISLTRLSDGTTATSNVPIGNTASPTRRISWRELITE